MTRPKRINLAGCVYHVICRADQAYGVRRMGSNTTFLDFFVEYVQKRYYSKKRERKKYLICLPRHSY